VTFAGWRQDDQFSVQQFLLARLVGELLELLKGESRGGFHGFFLADAGRFAS
jgi:hypothetical protein